MVMREQYPEIPEDETDRFVVDMLDCGILASFNAIGLVSVDGGFTLNYHVRVSEELGEARRLCARMADFYYQAARSLASDTTAPDMPYVPDDMRGALPRAKARYEEDLVINKGVPLADIDAFNDEYEPEREWWKSLGWPSYSEWQAGHRDMTR